MIRPENNPFGTGNYFTPDVYLFEETARNRLAICKPLEVALSLNIYLSTDGFGPTTPVKPHPCFDGVKPGGGNEMFTMRPVPYLTRQPSFHPLF